MSDLTNPGEIWDKLVATAAASTPKPESTPASDRRCRLALTFPHKTVQRSRVRPEILRSINQIDPVLRTAIRQVVSAEAPWPLFVWGPVGVGKTCAGLCVLDYSGGQYHTQMSLCDSLIRAQQGRFECASEGGGLTLSTEEFWRRLHNASLVVLDELASRERVSDHMYESVYRCVEERHARPLIVLSNLDLEGVEKVFDDRLASRLAAGTVVKIDGRDRRMRP